jgi:arsenate reductase-like glutaredoxin family protein
MCRIDAPYGNRALNEKPDPNERFVQALDESGIDGHVRALLVKHFSENWKRIFGSETDLENALTSAKQETSDPIKCAAMLASGHLTRKLNMELLMKHPSVALHTGVANQSSEVVLFAQEVAQTYFSDEPYAFFNAIRNLGTTVSLTLSCDWFITALYGEDFCFSRSLFDDPALIAEGDITRNDILWRFFNNMSQHDDESENENEMAGMCETPIKNLISVASLERHDGSPNLGSHKFLQGIRFLKAWVASDAAAGRLSSAHEGVFCKLDFEWSNLYSKIRLISSSNSAFQEVSDAAIAWLDKAKIKLQEAFCVHIDPTSADEHQIEQWASQLNSCFKSLSIRYPDILKQSPGEKDASENEHLKLLCSQLATCQIEAWIRWSIRKDIASALRQSDMPLLSREFCGDQSRKWWASEYPTTWKAKLEEELSRLDIKDKLTVLSGTLRRLPNESVALVYRAWWNDLFETLIQDPDFPVALTPQWTSAAVDRLDNELVIPYIDKSLGLLRGELSNGAQPYHHKQLEELLGKLRFFSPSKALRHSLMLVRSSTKPVSDESLSRFNPMNSESAIDWYWPLKEAAWDRFAKSTVLRTSVSREEYEQAELECNETFALELVEFCLSRLRLRKGEKPKDGKYDASQVTEKSPIWRQGYLKALLELGLDPGGKAHKTAYFTKQFDPDESVREVAKECYRAVRREAKKNRSIRDFRRGLIAAEWWLFMSQRLELNLNVNHEAALKTRRNLLRNPS